MRTFAAAAAIAALAAVTPAAAASAADSPGDGPTKGPCAYAPLEDQTYSTWTGLPQAPRKTPSRGEQQVTLQTNHGDVPLLLDRALAPCTVQDIVFLAHRKYFDDTTCHRLTAYQTPPFALSVLQCGDPLGSGWGDPGYSFKDELDSAKALANWPGFRDGSRKNYTRGTLAMANGGPDTNGSQFFLVYKDSRLRPDYTVFGHITEAGMKVLDEIAAGGIDSGTEGTPEDGAPTSPVVIERAKSGR